MTKWVDSEEQYVREIYVWFDVMKRKFSNKRVTITLEEFCENYDDVRRTEELEEVYNDGTAMKVMDMVESKKLNPIRVIVEIPKIGNTIQMLFGWANIEKNQGYSFKTGENMWARGNRG